MMKTHWEDRSKQWGKIGPPLNPNQEIVDAAIADDAIELIIGHVYGQPIVLYGSLGFRIARPNSLDHRWAKIYCCHMSICVSYLRCDT